MNNYQNNNQNMPLSDSDAKLWAMLVHLVSLVSTTIPFGNFIGALIIWAIFRDRSEFVNIHGKESLNFQISMAIYYGIATIFVFILIGIPALIFLGIFSFVVSIIAGIKAFNGEYYRYPMSIRFLK